MKSWLLDKPDKITPKKYPLSAIRTLKLFPIHFQQLPKYRHTYREPMSWLATLPFIRAGTLIGVITTDRFCLSGIITTLTEDITFTARLLRTDGMEEDPMAVIMAITDRLNAIAGQDNMRQAFYMALPFSPG